MLETRARLFDAALAEIGRSGLAGADVTAIASAAGVVRGTFYFHFPTKEHVLVELERNEEARIVAELCVAQTAADDLVSVLSLLVRHVIAAERRLGPVVFRDMLGLHFSTNRPIDEEVAEHPLAEFVIAAITTAQEAGRVPSEADAGRTWGVLHDRTLRAASYRQSRCRDGGRRRGSVCQHHRQRNGDTMNDTRIDGYRDFLKRRDGEADLLNRRLATREDFFNSLETNPVRSLHPADRPTFLRNLRRRKPEPGLDRKMLFLLATAKLNQAERFGVGLGETYGLNSDEDLPPERVYLELEEHYHTRLLAYVLDVFDLTFQVVPPPFVMRQFVKIGVFLPERLGFVFVGAAEMAGCVMFDELRRVGVELFADEPEVADRVNLLYSDILTDEVGHVGYCASRCTQAERALMRWLYPRIARLFARQTAEISLLVDRDKLHARLDRPWTVKELTAGLTNETYLVTHP